MGKRRTIQVLVVLGVMLGVFLLQIYSDLLGKNNQNTTREETVIQIWTIHGDTEKALKRVLDEYKNQESNIKFEVTVYKNEIYQTAVNNAIITNSLPDMFFMWGHSKINRLVEGDILQDITIEIQDLETISLLKENALEAFTYEDKVYALPLYGWRAYLFCNRDIFKQYGLAYPKTFEEFVEVSQKLKEEDIIPISTGGKEGWLSSLYYMSLLQGEGSGRLIYDAVNNPKLFSSEEFIDSAKKIEILRNEKVWQDDFMDYDGYNAVSLFSQGRTAMLYYGNWASTFLESEISKVNHKVDLTYFPSGNEYEGIGGYVDTFVINKRGVIAQDEKLIKMYIEMMKKISDIVVNDIGAGIPVYDDQTVDREKFPILYQAWQMYNNQILYPAYDQIMSEELSGHYYYLLNEFIYGNKSYEEFINELSSY